MTVKASFTGWPIRQVLLPNGDGIVCLYCKDGTEPEMSLYTASHSVFRIGDTVQFAALMSGIAVAIGGGDAAQIGIGSQAGGNAAANNYLAHNPDLLYQIDVERGVASCYLNSHLPRPKNRNIRDKRSQIDSMQISAGASNSR